MNDTTRNLISRMADELDQYRQLLLDDRSVTHRLADEARAALAEPEPEESPQPIPVLPEGTPIIEPPDHTLLAPIPQPVPVSERMPEEPLAWWFTPESDEEYGWWVLEPNGMEREPQPTHWLPAHTLPLPTTSRSNFDR